MTDSTIKVVDVITAEDTAGYCAWCCDPIERGEDIAHLSDGTRMHESCTYEALEL